MSAIQYLYICEKPSLAQAVAEALADMAGVKAVKADGAWMVGDAVRVAWLFGHMAELAEPSAYSERWARWTIDSLPVLVAETDWKLVVPDDKKAQTRKVEAFARQAHTIVSAGDAGREGELLVAELLLMWGIDAHGPNVKRLWVQSMARKDMIAALSGLLPAADKKTLYQAAVCRQRADWQHGMTFSRMYTLLAREAGADVVISVGRVQSPALRLVVDRDRQRLAFVAVDHFLPTIVFKHADGAFRAAWIVPADHDGLDSEGRLVDRAVAERVCAAVVGRDGAVKSFKSDVKIVSPPLPFSLSALQTECGSKLGMTAKEVLDTAQALYETHKATSYPRSDSRHLPLAILTDEAPGIMAALSGTPGLEDAARGSDLALKSAAWDDSKVSDHHGIIPTSEFTAAKLARMSDTERAVFMIVARTFIAQFHPGYCYRSLSAEIAVDAHRFKASGRQVVDPGWKRVFGAGVDDDADGDVNAETAQTLPAMAVGDAVRAEGQDLVAKRTSPPPAFTDGTLIDAMVNAHRFETNPDIKKRLKEGDGIGTEATRADTIQTLLGRKFVRRRGKNGLESSDLGRSVIDMLPEDLKSLGLTALWDGYLKQIERGTLDPSRFMELQGKTIAQQVADKKGTPVVVRGVATVAPLPGHGGDCTACGRGRMVTRSVTSGKTGKKYVCLSCTNYPDCRAVVWPDPDIKPLPGHGKPCPTCGKGVMKTREVTSKKNGRKHLCLSCSAYPECRGLEWPEPDLPPLPGHGAACAACGKGVMKTREAISKKTGKPFVFLSCTAYPACSAIAFPEPPPIEGHGKPCPTCGKGVMKTRTGTGKDGRQFTCLSCSDYPNCRSVEFRESSVAPLPGDGKACPKCGKGRMTTREFVKKSDKTTFKKLSCSAYPACDYGEFPERAAGGGGNAGAGKSVRAGVKGGRGRMTKS